MIFGSRCDLFGGGGEGGREEKGEGEEKVVVIDCDR